MSCIRGFGSALRVRRSACSGLISRCDVLRRLISACGNESHAPGAPHVRFRSIASRTLAPDPGKKRGHPLAGLAQHLTGAGKRDAEVAGSAEPLARHDGDPLFRE